MRCSALSKVKALVALRAGTLAALPGCNNNWSTWWIGSRTQWNVSPDTYLALDVLYSKLKSGRRPTANGALGTGLAIGNASFVSDEDNWFARFRVHKDFYP